MRIGIVGSRNFGDLEKVKEYVKSLDEDTIIVSGGAKGVDETAAKVGEELGMKVVSFTGNGIKDICKYSDMICAFWDGKSKGTKNTKDTAKKMNMIVQVFTKNELLAQRDRGE
jgi:hypothetical protein|tara:strand:- start:486 stop:824 length:339 start_codon:yes stop_codon:yes gene_type:complete